MTARSICKVDRGIRGGRIVIHNDSNSDDSRSFQRLNVIPSLIAQATPPPLWFVWRSLRMILYPGRVIAPFGILLSHQVSVRHKTSWLFEARMVWSSLILLGIERKLVQKRLGSCHLTVGTSKRLSKLTQFVLLWLVFRFDTMTWICESDWLFSYPLKAIVFLLPLCVLYILLCMPRSRIRFPVSLSIVDLEFDPIFRIY